MYYMIIIYLYILVGEHSRHLTNKADGAQSIKTMRLHLVTFLEVG